MKQEIFSIAKRLKSFSHAFNGLKILVTQEHNSRIHFLAAIIVISTALFLKVSSYEWIALIFAIGCVIVTEIINSAIENVADFISPEKNEKIKVIKDLSAAAVLIASFTAVVIGLIIFAPKLLALN